MIWIYLNVQVIYLFAIHSSVKTYLIHSAYKKEEKAILQKLDCELLQIVNHLKQISSKTKIYSTPLRDRQYIMFNTLLRKSSLVIQNIKRNEEQMSWQLAAQGTYADFITFLTHCANCHYLFHQVLLRSMNAGDQLMIHMDIHAL